ncbi:MAG: 23S rRNA (uracil(1939)-C(5))-methyltransferase RlmD [Saprospiraceae bacterium]|nr:23S rRNA (uracil(1939)-C(5))-methyltransferase RlmD [Saprospiraceae bacterium]
MRKNKPQKTVRANITGIAHNGMSVGRTPEGMVVFVERGAPGDVADVLLSHKRKGSWYGRIEQLVEPSAHRTEPHCAHFGHCGGCSWQHISYGEQLRQKERWVLDALQRIAKIESPPLEPILPADETQYYRNKLEFSFSTSRWYEVPGSAAEEGAGGALGFHRPGNFNKVIDISHCHHQGGDSNAIRNFVRNYAQTHSLDFYDIRRHEGLLRSLMLRSNLRGDFMCILTIGKEDPEKIAPMVEAMREAFPSICSMYTVYNPRQNDSLYGLRFQKISGDAYLTESLHHADFLIGPSSFFQTNSRQAANLFKLVESYCSLTGKEHVLDLYCGVGSIGIYLARNAARITGVETVPEAIDDARRNAAANALSNCQYHVAQAEQLNLPGWVKNNGVPDIVVVDPPRLGLHQKVCTELLEVAPQKIVYVSCNPSTQARDIEWLAPRYQVQSVRPVDMFPHTNHVESVALLSLCR